MHVCRSRIACLVLYGTRVMFYVPLSDHHIWERHLCTPHAVPMYKRP